MRWQELFADLEAQARSLEQEELETEIVDRIRGEIAEIRLINRIRSAVGSRIRLQVQAVGLVEGRLDRVGKDWLLLATPYDVVIATAAVGAALDLPVAAVSPDGLSPLESKLGLTAVLRAIAVDRSAVTVRLRDGSSYTGTPDRVGADFVDVSLHDLADPRRDRAVRGRCTIAFAALAAVSRHGDPWAAP